MAHPPPGNPHLLMAEAQVISLTVVVIKIIILYFLLPNLVSQTHATA